MLCLLDLSIQEPFGSANLYGFACFTRFLRFRVRYEVFKVRFAEGFRVTRLLFRRRFAWRTFKTIHEGKSRRPREIAAKVAYIPQTHTPTFHYTVLEMVLMGTTHRVRGLQSPGAKEVAIAREALAQVGIADMENRRN